MTKIVRYLSYIEGASLLLLLFVAMPIKYLAGDPSFVRVVGMAHGVLFIGLVLLVCLAAYLEKWNLRLVSFALISSCLPFGMLAFDRELKKHSA